ncbi:methyltransferase type 11 [Candidatus Wolfebacteria bacterium CG03_land_8_20_14_0_80_40_12]|uniref:Methyltransferase type 11 n=1 Tax=Candidatus Wolfebacteria bacterium CG03_land_8_20_14_0_80_40_12 TaxID=1975069 RepID=A0A2M7B5G3_9BACT|nr:MAG: methyltransferase type 11 [Candidatus Wolfebacteria bacterium CG03_land_8_20_14_0_80_40_12]
MAEINLLDVYPNPKRDVEWRFRNLTSEQREMARQFGREFFDGDRLWGYGGYIYDGRWISVVEKFRDYYELTSESNVLDVGCAKGFMLHDFRQVIPGIKVAGIDVSEYAIENAMDDVRPFVQVANAKDLPFPDKSFDLVISINTVHNLEIEECKQAITEIERVKKKNAFLVLDSFRNQREEDRMRKWNITGKTILSVTEWLKVFAEVGYTGDYYWFIP